MQNSKDTEDKKSRQGGVGSEGVTDSSSVSTISIGEREKQLLNHLHSIGSQWFNKRAYSRSTGTPRSSVYDIITRLQSKGLIDDSSNVTKKGMMVLDVHHNSVGAVRKTAAPGTLSTHYLRYKFKIVDRSKFYADNIKKLNPIKYKPNKLPNYTQYHIYFDGVTVIVDLNTVSIRIHDLLVEDTDESNYESFSKAVNVVDQLNNIGIKGTDLSLTQGHYARVESYLSDFLQKVDDRYFLTLSDGSKFWIDNSDGHLEDETDSQTARERLDSFMDTVMSSDIDLGDVDRLKNVSRDLVGVCAANMKQHEGSIQAINALASKLKDVVKINENIASGVEAITNFLQVTQMNQYSKDQNAEGSHDKPNYFG